MKHGTCRTRRTHCDVAGDMSMCVYVPNNVYDAACQQQLWICFVLLSAVLTVVSIILLFLRKKKVLARYLACMWFEDASVGTWSVARWPFKSPGALLPTPKCACNGTPASPSAI